MNIENQRISVGKWLVIIHEDFLVVEKKETGAYIFFYSEGDIEYTPRNGETQCLRQ